MPEEKKRKVPAEVDLEAQQAHQLASKLQKETFPTIWEFYKAKEKLDTLAKGTVAAHFFYLGAKAAFAEKLKDYKRIKQETREQKMGSIHIENKLREIKQNALKLKKKGGLDIRRTIEALKKAIDENKNDAGIVEALEKEILFLKQHEKKRLE